MGLDGFRLYKLLRFVLMSLATMSSLGCGGTDEAEFRGDETSTARLDLEMKDLALTLEPESLLQLVSGLNEINISNASPRYVFAQYRFVSPSGTTHIKLSQAESSFTCPEGDAPDSISYILFPAGHSDNKKLIHLGKTYPLGGEQEMVLIAKILNTSGCSSMRLNFRVQIIRD